MNDEQGKEKQENKVETKQNQDKKEQKMKKKKSKMNSEKHFYLFTAISCAVALVAIVVIAVAVSVGDGTQEQGNVGEKPGVETPIDPPVGGGSVDDGQEDQDDEQVVVTPEGMIAPVEKVAVMNEHGFYHNKTLNSYYEHKGVDFATEVGASVFAVEKGVVESIFTGDVLTGTEIVIAHEDGLKSVYRFIEQAEHLKVGDKVEKGQVIATVAEANGNEYKDGAHLHFEVLKGGESIDPSVYLTMEEK
jgi:murein DD-endopeptidase MepM/ murein hydrolase activator NlpD